MQNRNTRLLALAALTIMLFIANLEAKTGRVFQVSETYNKTITNNMIVSPYSSYIQNNYSYLLRTQPTIETSKYTNKSVTGFEKSNKKDFSEKILGNNSKISFDPNIMPGLLWGQTDYDFQSNAAMAERIKLYQSSGKVYLQNMWMCNLNPSPGWPERGSYYEVINATDPSKMSAEGYFDSPIEKIGAKTLRTGWPAIVQFPDGSVGTASHDSTGPNPFRSIVWSKNTAFKNTAFATSILSNTNPLWARTAIDGKGYLHTIYTWTNNSNTMDKFGQLGYRRSTDGGKTWSSEILFTGANAFDGIQNNGGGADEYAIDARDNKVVITYYDSKSNFNYRVSTDNGATWSAPNVAFKAPHQNFYQLADLGNGKFWVGSDTTYTPGPHMDVIIDSKGTSHFVCSVIPGYVRGIATIENNQITSMENDTTFSGSIYLAVGFYYNYENSNKAGYLFGNPQGETTDQFGENKMRISRRWGASYSFTPNLAIDNNDNLYCSYSGIVLDDTKDVVLDEKDANGNKTGEQTVQGFFGHLYITWKSSETGRGWSKPNQLTPNGADVIFPSMCNSVYVDNSGKKWLYVAYSANSIPGDKVTTSELPAEDDFVFTMAQDASLLNESPVVESVENNILDNGNAIIEVSPNPASEFVNIKISSNENDAISNIAIFDIFGNKIISINEGRLLSNNQIIPVNVNGLSSGLYSINLTANGKRVTKLFTVVK